MFVTKLRYWWHRALGHRVWRPGMWVRGNHAGPIYMCDSCDGLEWR